MAKSTIKYTKMTTRKQTKRKTQNRCKSCGRFM